MASQPGVARDAQDFFDHEITFRGGRGTDGIGFVGEAHVERGAIHVAIDRNRAHAEFAACAHDAHRDFAAIGNQDFLEHFSAPDRTRILAFQRRIRARVLKHGWPGSRLAKGRHRICVSGSTTVADHIDATATQIGWRNYEAAVLKNLTRETGVRPARKVCKRFGCTCTASRARKCATDCRLSQL